VTSHVLSDAFIILDGYSGVVIIITRLRRRSRSTKRRSREMAKFEHGLNDLRELPAQTMDGKHVELLSNIEFAEEIRFPRHRVLTVSDSTAPKDC